MLALAWPAVAVLAIVAVVVLSERRRYVDTQGNARYALLESKLAALEASLNQAIARQTASQKAAEMFAEAATEKIKRLDARMPEGAIVPKSR